MIRCTFLAQHVVAHLMVIARVICVVVLVVCQQCSGIRHTVLDQMFIASPTVIARALSDSL
eukprot:3227625-Heterocapsa_arctica.AAC.1